jgi:anti-anti-sigma factor
METTSTNMTSPRRFAQTQATVLRLAETEYGSHDHAKLAQVHRQLLELAEKPGPPLLVVDLSSVRYFGARFIATLVSTAKQLRKRDRQLALYGLAPLCTELTQNLQLHMLFEIYPTQPAALEEIERKARCNCGETQTFLDDLPTHTCAWLPRQPDRWYDNRPVPCLQHAGAC